MSEQLEKYYLIKPSDLLAAAGAASISTNVTKAITKEIAELLLEAAADIRTRKEAEAKARGVHVPQYGRRGRPKAVQS